MDQGERASLVKSGQWDGTEKGRLCSLSGHPLEALLDDEELDAITGFAARLCRVPTALVSLVEDERQFFLARTGLDAKETPRSQSFCAHAMLKPEVMEVTDARDDPRFADNPLVTGDLGIRFYAGAPLVADDGAPLGALCVIDYAPRPAGLDDFQREGLTVLAAAVMRRLKDKREELASDRARRELAESERRFATLADTMPQMVWSTRPDGYHDYYNARWYEYTGMPVGSTDGEEWNGMFHPDDQERAWERWSQSLKTGEPYEIEYRLRDARGDYRWTLGRAMPMRDEAGNIVRWFGTCTDIHDQKSSQEDLDLLSRELVHRIKNIFSLVGGIVSLTARENPEARAAFGDLSSRLGALSRAYDFTNPTGVEGGSLTDLLGRLFAPYRAEGEPRIRVGGEDVMVSGTAATALSLLFHELATNAVKYGALSNDSGGVDVTLASPDNTVRIDWVENGGPPIDTDRGAQGFGTALIESTVVRQLKGTIDRRWPRTGLQVTVELPAPRLA